MRKSLFPIGSLLVATSAVAQTTKFADPALAVSLPSSGASSMGQVTIALLIVLVVLFAAAWAMRQFKLLNRSADAVIEVMQGVNLGPKERAVLIRVQGRRLLLGVAPGCVNLLLELAPDATDETSAAAPTSVATALNTPNFKALLKRSMGLS